jgi:hypothetical protein
MKSQIPAEGILLINDWGHAKMYKAVCECHSDDHSHVIDIESDDSVNITIYSSVATNFWSKTRWYHIWQLLTRGRAEFESTIVLSQQSALNYAETIKSAVDAVSTFRRL